MTPRNISRRQSDHAQIALPVEDIDRRMLANKENKVLGIADKALADCGVDYKMG